MFYFVVSGIYGLGWSWSDALFMQVLTGAGPCCPKAKATAAGPTCTGAAAVAGLSSSEPSGDLYDNVQGTYGRFDTVDRVYAYVPAASLPTPAHLIPQQPERRTSEVHPDGSLSRPSVTGRAQHSRKAQERRMREDSQPHAHRFEEEKP